MRVRKERAVLVGCIVRGDDGHTSDNLVELTALAETAGAIVVDTFQQKVYKVNPATYIGSGKAKQLGERVVKYKADVVYSITTCLRGRFVSLKILSKRKCLIAVN